MIDNVKSTINKVQFFNNGVFNCVRKYLLYKIFLNNEIIEKHIIFRVYGHD